MLTALFLRSPTNLRAYGADDELSQHVLDPVLSLGHSNSPLLAHFCQAPKKSGGSHGGGRVDDAYCYHVGQCGSCSSDFQKNATTVEL